MADSQVTVESAVVLPDSEEARPSPPAPLKRKQSLGSEGDSKRLRRNSKDQSEARSADASKTSPEAERRRDRRIKGEIEERKRGQRLFGALLGTLSQRSSITQKRRADIEKRQQAKLKLQAAEYDEKKRKQLGELKVVRRREQQYYEKHQMETIHANIMADANFLKTKTKPILYYRPWELRPEEEKVIDEQIRDTKELVEKQKLEFEERMQKDHNDGDDAAAAPLAVEDDKSSKVEDAPRALEPVGSNTDQSKSPEPAKVDATNNQDGPVSTSAHTQQEQEQEQVAATTTNNQKIQEEENAGEVMLEGEEDTVIY